MTDQNVEMAAAVAAIQTMINGVMADVLPMAQDAAAHASGLIDVISEGVAAPLAEIIGASQVNLPGDDADGPLDWSAYDAVANATGDSLAVVAGDTAKIADAISTHTQGLTAMVMPGTGDALNGVLRVIGDLVSGLLGSLADNEELWSSLYTILRKSFVEDRDPITAFTQYTARAIAHTLGDVLSQSFNGYRIMGSAVMTGNDAVALNPDQLAARMDAWPAWLKSIVDVALEFVSAWSILSAMASPKVSEAEQAANKENPIRQLSPPELVSLIRRGEIGADWGRDHAKRSGVSNELFDLMYKLTRSFLTTENYVEMWRRTGDDSELDMLRSIGIDDADIGRLKYLATANPTPSDLVRFMVRDAFDPDAIASGQLDYEFEKKYDPEWTRKVGINVETLKLYWMSHWSLPSPTMFYEMFHRGFIDATQLRAALAVADYAPGWIDHLIDINYNVPGRIDVRRMWEAGIITDHVELVKRHTDMGYSPTDAETLSRFVEQLSAKTKTADAERERAPIVKAVLDAYGKGVVTYDAAISDLVALGLDDEHARYRIQVGDFQREEDRTKRITDAIGREYTRGFIGHDEAYSRLDGYGFDPTEIDSVLASWDLDRELADLSAEKHHQRDLTKSEVLASYADDILDAADTAAHLTALGYDGPETAALIQLEDTKAAKRDAAIAEQAVHSQYVTRRIDDTGARDQLTALGFSQRRIDARLAKWTVEREDKRPDVGQGDLHRMLTLGVIPIDRMESILLERGFTPEDASLLLTLWGTELSVAQATIDERKREFELREQRLNAAQEATQARFQDQQAQQRALQDARLAATQASRASQQAFTTQRDAASFERTLQRQHDTQANSNAQLQKRLDATAAEHAKALDAAATIQTRREQAQALARDAQDARQTRTLQAQADRLTQQLTAATARADAAAAAREALAASHQAGQEKLVGLRDTLQQARDIRANAAKIAAEQRNEAARIRQENRGQARKDSGLAAAAADKARLDALRLQRDQAVAELNARLAGLEATAAAQRLQDALAQRQASQETLARNTPVSELVSSSI